MKAPLGLWFLILLYTLVSISVKLHPAPMAQISACLESCYSVDTNEVDQGQISIRTKLASSGLSFNNTEVLKVLSLSQYSANITKLNFAFLEVHPLFQFAQKSFRPPITILFS